MEVVESEGSMGSAFLVNARRAEEMGIAVAFGVGEAQTPALLSAAENAQIDPELRATAHAVRAECDAMAPISEAVPTLERVAEGVLGAD